MRPACRGGRDRNDVARRSRFHPGQHTLQGEKRGGQVCVDRRSPAFLTRLLERSGTSVAGTGVCHEYVDGSEFLLDVATQRLDVVESSHVTGDVTRSEEHTSELQS